MDIYIYIYVYVCPCTSEKLDVLARGERLYISSWIYRCAHALPNATRLVAYPRLHLTSTRKQGPRTTDDDRAYRAYASRQPTPAERVGHDAEIPDRASYRYDTSSESFSPPLRPLGHRLLRPPDPRPLAPRCSPHPSPPPTRSARTGPSIRFGLFYYYRRCARMYGLRTHVSPSPPPPPPPPPPSPPNGA